MATRMDTTITDRRFFGFSLQTVILTAGAAILAPYLIRRFLPLLNDRMNVTGNDVAIAGKDSVRDVADDMGVGGVSGQISRGIDRVADRLSH